MKNIIKTLSVGAMLLAVNSAFADTQVIDGKTYLVYDNPLTNQTLDSAAQEVWDNGYAGLVSSANLELKYEFNAYSASAPYPVFKILNATDDITIKNTLNFSFSGNDWGGRSFVQFDIAAGKTLKLEDVYVSYTETRNNSRLVFNGEDSKNISNAVLTFRNNSMAKSSLVMENVNVSYTNSSLSNGITIFWNYSTLNLNGKFTTEELYVSPGKADDSIVLNMNGHDLVTGNYINNGGDLTPNINVFFGDDADADGYVNFIVNGGYNIPAKYTSSTITFHDFDYGEDRFISQKELPTNLSLIFKGYEDKEIICEKLTSGEYKGYYSYYVIPEPSTYAMIFGALALGFVAYRRRK